MDVIGFEWILMGFSGFSFFLTCRWEPPDLDGTHGSGSHDTYMDRNVPNVPNVPNSVPNIPWHVSDM